MDLAELARAAQGPVRPRRGIQRGRRSLNRAPRQRKVRATKPAASDTLAATRELLTFARSAITDVKAKLFPALRAHETEFLQDSALVVEDDFADDLNDIMIEIRANAKRLADERASLVSRSLTGRVDHSHRRRFYKTIEDVIGIDLSLVADESGLTPILKLKTQENVGLITSIADEYLDKVERLVFESVIQGRSSSRSMIEEIVEIGGVTEARARFIARDQTAKLNAAMNRERNQALGIEEYIWRDSDDERVRKGKDGTENGPGSHRAKDGKTYRWDSPPPDTGHPGEDYQCRCTAEPVIVI